MENSRTPALHQLHRAIECFRLDGHDVLEMLKIVLDEDYDQVILDSEVHKELERKAKVGEALEKALEYENGFVLDDGGIVLSDVEALLNWANSEGNR